jgi:hypothetical protein
MYKMGNLITTDCFRYKLRMMLRYKQTVRERHETTRPEKGEGVQN